MLKTPLQPSAWAAGFCVLLLVCVAVPGSAASRSIPAWKPGTPIVTYWAGPGLTDAFARQLAEGGFNLAWGKAADLDTAARHGLRVMVHDSLLSPKTLDDPAQRDKLDALIARVRPHRAFYSYFLTDEPGAADFPALGRLVAYLRERDPAHLPYINLFPTYASNEQLGTRGDSVTAYRAHLEKYLAEVRPPLVSYDHYQFGVKGDGVQYFLNLALIREASQAAAVPFLNIVQACTWSPSMRVPTTNEVRYLISTTAAYGAQGVSYYVYCHPGHTGGIALPDGTPTPLYHALKIFNREFVAQARELLPLRSLGVYHTSLTEAGCVPPPADAPFRVAQPSASARGFLLGCFGKASQPTHCLVVNLDYQAPAVANLAVAGKLQRFNPRSVKWSRLPNSSLELAPGEGQLVRLAR
jgi:hypothetical protein